MMGLIDGADGRSCGAPLRANTRITQVRKHVEHRSGVIGKDASVALVGVHQLRRFGQRVVGDARVAVMRRVMVDMQLAR